MFGFIRSISFTSQVMIPILGLILFGIGLVFPGDFQNADTYGNGFYYLPDEGWFYPIWIGLVSLPLWVQTVPACLMAILTAGLLVGNDSKNLLIGNRSYAIAYVFLFLVTSSGHYFLFHPAMLAGYFMVLSYRFLLDLYKDESAYSIVFAMGFSWGIAILLYPPVCFLVPALLLGLLLMVTAGWRHWLVSLLGISVPVMLISIIWFLLGDLSYQASSFLSWFKFRHSLIPGFFARDPILVVWIGLIFIWAIIASIRYRNPKIQSRQLFQANFVLFVSILLVILFVDTVSVEVLWLLIIPLAYLMTFWALKIEKGWFRDLFFGSLLIFFLWFRIRGLI